MVSRFRGKRTPDSPRVIPGNPMRFIDLEVVARDGIEPSTRGFSRRRRGRFGASKPKTGDEFSRGRPNRPRRPSPYRTEPRNSDRTARGPDSVQRLARIATERFPNRAPNGAALGSGALALTTSRPAPRFTTPQSGQCTVKDDPLRTTARSISSPASSRWRRSGRGRITAPLKRVRQVSSDSNDSCRQPEAHIHTQVSGPDC